ncbi:MAG: hypothetical protein SFX73_10890 [Kofleriaceae bacterium]|nr:hypothetical protein [Kofleriaceae bacterium]
MSATLKVKLALVGIGVIVILMLTRGTGAIRYRQPVAVSAVAVERASVRVPRLEAPPVALPFRKSFVLLDAGTGPKSSLRYAHRGTATFLSETHLTSRRLADGTWSAAQPITPIRSGFVITVGERAPTMRARALPGELLGAPTSDATAFLAAWKAIEGRELSLELDRRGLLGKIVFADDPKNQRSREANDEVVQRLLTVFVPVPEEPVGVGATWRVITVLRQAPAVVRQTATYKLLGRGPDGWQIGVEILRFSGPQALDESLELVALVRKLSGTLVVDPGHPLPTGELAFESTLHVRVSDRARGRREEIVEDTGVVRLSSTSSP